MIESNRTLAVISYARPFHSSRQRAETHLPPSLEHVWVLLQLTRSKHGIWIRMNVLGQLVLAVFMFLMRRMGNLAEIQLR